MLCKVIYEIRGSEEFVKRAFDYFKFNITKNKDNIQVEHYSKAFLIEDGVILDECTR